MAPELSRLVARVTFALLTLAAVAVEIAANDGRSVLQSVGLAAAWVLLAALIARFMIQPTDPRQKPPVWVLLVLISLAAAPFALEPIRRNWMGDGYPLELQMVCSLRNVGLGLAACAGWLLCLRLACVTSLFLILFSAAMTNHPAVMVILGLYTAVGSFWLMLVYWAGLRGIFVTSDKAISLEIQERGERLPWLGLGVLAILLSTALALVVLGPKRVAFALGELMPTSGGTGETDPFARYGIGDGPEETAGENAKAAGMVETDRMIEDNKNSLIDAVNDMYGPPHKPPKNQERMVAAGQVDVIQFHGKLPDNRRPSRDFETSRRGPSGNRKPESQAARGLFEIQGRTPLHIRLVAYEAYDPVDHRWLEARKPSSRLIEPEGSDWMKMGQFKAADWYASDDRHRLKVAELKSNLVPTPSLLTRFRINKVDKPDYYEWDFDGVLALSGRQRTPPGVVITTDCRTLEPSRLPEVSFAKAGIAGGLPALLGEVPDAIRPQIAQLAQDWIGDRPRGWPQIDAILTKLRTGYQLDRTSVPPADHPSPVLWFLTESQRGPDYLFASSAALMLRTLGYSTRVCLGYYAGSEEYDPETDHTPVKASDLHFWPEIVLQDGQWLVIEPTPGYDVLGPRLPLSERILLALAAMAVWAWRHGLELGLLFALLLTVWILRRHLIDRLTVWLWLWRPGATWRDQVRRVVAVLERRGGWAGQPRSHRQTVLAWLKCKVANRPDAGPLQQLLPMAEWAAYAAADPPPWSETEVYTVCRRVLQEWKLSRWVDPKQTSAIGD